MASTIRPHLLFEGDAEEAMNFYVDLFDDGEIIDVERYGPDEECAGMIERAMFTIVGREFFISDNTVEQAFTFTPSISLSVEFEADDELERLYDALSEDGEVMMPLDSYDFSDKFGYVTDRFGVAWQLDLV